MNNSKLIEYFPKEEPKDIEVTVEQRLPKLREREGELVRLIDAIRSLESSKDWSTLKTEVFEGLVDSLERKLMQEAKKRPLSIETIYELQGQLTWAKKYANLDSLAQSYMAELTNIRFQLNGK